MTDKNPQHAGAADPAPATLTLGSGDAGPVLTATGGNTIPAAISLVDDAGVTIAVYTAEPSVQPRTGATTRWQMR
jgi:hypothetical protein